MSINISVIVPVYKIAYENLREMIKSLKDQDYDQAEYILVDDGSPDDCGKICDVMCADDKRFRVIHTKNYGVSHARNIGLDNAKGAYIVFVDGDDQLSQGSLSLYGRWITKVPCDLMIGNYQINDNDIKVTHQIHVLDKKDQLIEVQKSFLSGKGVDGYHYNGAPWGKLYNTDLIRSNHLRFDENLPRSQDNEFNFRYMHYVKKCMYIDENVYKYTINSTSAMRKYWPNAILNADKFLDKILQDIECENTPIQYYDAYYKIGFSKLFDIMNTFIFHRENTETINNKIKVLKNLCESSRYQRIIHNVKTDSSSYRKIIVMCLRIHAYYATYILIAIRKKIQGQL